MCRLSLDEGANVDHVDNPPLHLAAWKGHLSVVKLLL
jgi:hypothetical protein